jgi:hypothetical protein
MIPGTMPPPPMVALSIAAAFVGVGLITHPVARRCGRRIRQEWRAWQARRRFRRARARYLAAQAALNKRSTST